MSKAKKSRVKATPDTSAEKKEKFEAKQINVGRERAEHRRKLKTVAKKGQAGRGDPKRSRSGRTKTARKKR